MEKMEENGFGKIGFCFHIYHLHYMEKLVKYGFGKKGFDILFYQIFLPIYVSAGKFWALVLLRFIALKR
jgi:hypothetical protein